MILAMTIFIATLLLAFVAVGRFLDECLEYHPPDRPKDYWACLDQFLGMAEQLCPDILWTGHVVPDKALIEVGAMTHGPHGTVAMRKLWMYEHTWHRPEDIAMVMAEDLRRKLGERYAMVGIRADSGGPDSAAGSLLCAAHRQ